jgi:hypothetical protein
MLEKAVKHWKIAGAGGEYRASTWGQLLCLPLLQEVGVGVTGESSISIDVLGDDER